MSGNGLNKSKRRANRWALCPIWSRTYDAEEGVATVTAGASLASLNARAGAEADDEDALAEVDA
jgi:hypothetical protein